MTWCPCRIKLIRVVFHVPILDSKGVKLSNWISQWSVMEARLPLLAVARQQVAPKSSEMRELGCLAGSRSTCDGSHVSLVLNKIRR